MSYCQDKDESVMSDAYQGVAGIPLDAAELFSIVNEQFYNATRYEREVPLYTLGDISPECTTSPQTDASQINTETDASIDGTVGGEEKVAKKRLRAQRNRNRASMCDEDVPQADIFPITHMQFYQHVTGREDSKPMFKMTPEPLRQNVPKKTARVNIVPQAPSVEQKKSPRKRTRSRKNKKDGTTIDDQEGEAAVPLKHITVTPNLPTPLLAEKKTAQQKRKERARETRRSASSRSSSQSEPIHLITKPVEEQEPYSKQAEKKKAANKQLQLNMSNLEKDFIYPLKKTPLSHPNAKFYCRLCQTHLDDVGRCHKHLRNNRHIRLKRLRTAELVDASIPPPTKAHTSVLSRLLMKVYETQGLSEKDMESRQIVTDKLESLLKKLAPDSEVNMYGSSRSGLGLKSSDVNIDLKSKKAAAALKTLFHTLKDDTSGYYATVLSDFGAHVPCVHFTIPSLSSLKVQVGVTVGAEFGASSMTTELLRLYASIDPRVKQLTVPLRYWAKLCGIDKQDQGTLPAYVFGLMTIFFLQQCQPPVLPVLHEVGSASERNGGCSDNYYFNDIHNLSAHWQCKNSEEIGALWLRMCRFYAVDFDNKECVICIRQRAPLRRSEKKWTKRLPIEDPFMRRRNVTRSLSHVSVFEYIFDRLRFLYQYFAIPRTKDGPLLKESDFGKLEERLAQTMKAEQLEMESSLPNGTLTAKASETTKSVSKFGHSFKFGKGDNFKFNFDLMKEEEDQEGKKSDGAGDGRSNGESTRDEYFDKVASDVLSGAMEQVKAKDEKDEDGDLIGSPVRSVTVPVDDVDSEVSAITSNIDKVPVPDIPKLAEHIVHVAVSEAMRITAASTAAKEPAGSSSGKEMENEGDTKGPNRVVLYDQKLVNSLSESDYVYNFDADTLTDKTGPSLWCASCQRQGHLKQNCPDEVLPELKPLPPLSRRYKLMLNQVLTKVPSDFEPSAQEKYARENLRSMLEKYIQAVFPSARLSLFGSSCNGFGFSHSDLDICLVFDDDPDGSTVDCVAVIERLYKHLRKQPSLNNVIAITNAKVPIVKFWHKYSGLEGDISLYNTLAVHNTHMLELYSQLDPRVRALGYTMKVFAKLCDICDASKGSLSSYAYILMVIYFLQQRKPPVLPVLQELHKGEKPELIVDKWNAWYYNDINTIGNIWSGTGKNQESLAELWIGLLRFYTEEFNFKDYVVCIRQEEPLTRFEKLWNGKCIAIEDPFDLGHNLGGGLSARMNTFILKAFHNGRTHFGMSIDQLPPHYSTIEDFLFDPKILTSGSPPSDRNCRKCGRIGHWVKECPQNPDNMEPGAEKDEALRKQSRDRRRRQKDKQQGHGRAVVKTINGEDTSKGSQQQKAQQPQNRVNNESSKRPQNRDQNKAKTQPVAQGREKNVGNIKVENAPGQNKVKSGAAAKSKSAGQGEGQRNKQRQHQQGKADMANGTRHRVGYRISNPVQQLMTVNVGQSMPAMPPSHYQYHSVDRHVTVAPPNAQEIKVTNDNLTWQQIQMAQPQQKRNRKRVMRPQAHAQSHAHAQYGANKL